MNMLGRYVGHPDEAFVNPTEWLNRAIDSKEHNRKHVACQIGACEIVYDITTLKVDSYEKLQAVCRMAHMVDFLTKAGLFITEDGSIGVGRVSSGSMLIPCVTLSLAYNIDVLTSPDVNYLVYQERIPCMTLCKADMGAFWDALRERKVPALLLTGIGWWDVGQRRE